METSQWSHNGSSSTREFSLILNATAKAISIMNCNNRLATKECMIFGRGELSLQNCLWIGLVDESGIRDPKLMHQALDEPGLFLTLDTDVARQSIYLALL